ncbi:S8 family serine peptidase [Aeromicrobium fastidiosum]|uniref:S8 family serine peptidase n=1 Tax=Aeromicrobium fastidiosum TaxID=52699 RepID=UPI0020237426|nr:S8 family serine peptidase [Aeromicrobium fastidiosum]MCL8252544.1 S8 family serine peptidase [Aeromicrobium fastidiosum]
MAHRRIILTLATGLALTLGSAPAVAASDPSAGEVASVLESAPAGEPVTVVTTTQTATGPQFTTEVADSRQDARELISAALDEPGVTVDVAHPVSIASTLDTSSAQAPVASAATAAASKKPKRSNDSLRKRQWSLDKLRAEQVWRKSKGRGVVVAVVDTGVQADHPDLKGRVLKGRDFVEDDRNAADRNGHGTHVAGVIAAKAGNKRGIAGLAPQSRILPVRVLNSAGAGNTVDASRGIVWAVNKGADVINLSFAGKDLDVQMQKAVRYAVRKGVVVVAAAGNQGCSGPTTYPAALPGVIGVAATNRYDRVAPFSTCGPAVDVSAPGVSIRSTMIKRPSMGLPCRYGQSYCLMSGTSMASPHVAAAAAIVIARTRHRLGAAAVGDLLTTRATDIGAPGYDTASGHGFLNVRRSLLGR